jgi:Peptidase family M1 domain
MRLQAAALVVSLAVTGGPSDPRWYAVSSGVSRQDTPGDSVQLFLVRLERIVQRGDAAAYVALLDESADRDRADRFVDGELIPGMTRAVLQERDRGPLPGTLSGDGFTVVVDAFEEFGDRARVSTWWLDLTRDRNAAAGAEWLIADQGRLSSVEDLYRLSLNPAAQFTAHNLEFRDEDLKLTLPTGSVFVADTDQGTTALVLLGRGDMSFHPAPQTEKSQVRIFSNMDGIETRFDAAYLRINPGDFDRLISSRQLVSRPVDPSDFRAADRVFREDFPKSFSLDIGDLSRDAWSLLPRPGDLVAEIHTRKFDTLSYSRSSSAREDISLFNRDRRKTIAQYSSSLNERQDVPRGDEDDDTDFDVWHYDIDVSATPDRRWIDGSARLSIRVGAKPISSLTLRLAESLVVQSVVSEEYGRMFNMRVKDQNSVVVSLPATLPPGAELTLAVTYAGRLEPQTLDVETMAAGQIGATPQSDAADSLGRPEPSFVYSNQSNWYPRPSANHHATARLRITVPANLACVASGERDPESPAFVIAKDSSRQKVYVFNAVQPLRYLAFVVSRLDTARSIATDSLKVSVEANPGHAKRGRDLADRTVEIARFYQSLLEDVPYPTFTIALVEGDLPGGHSPGYFAVLNEPPSSLPPFASRNDPASFDNYPDFFLAHELAHQWWGQAVGWRNYHEQWLSEGFAQYFAAMYAGQRVPGGPGSLANSAAFRSVMRHMRKWAIDESDQGPISLGYRLGHIQGDSRIMRALVYDKGAIVLHMLRGLVGDDAFFRGLQRFYRASRFRSARTVDFRVAMEEEAGRPLGRFFDRWIYGSALPRLNFSYRVDGPDVVLHVEQVGDAYDLPITVTLQYADRTSADVLIPVTEPSVDVRVPLTGSLRTVDISKDDFSLASITKNRP